MDALDHVALYLKGQEQRLDFLQRVLQSFIQQGIEGKRASERKEVSYSLKASSSSFSLGLLLPVLATVWNSNYYTYYQFVYIVMSKYGSIIVSFSTYFETVS